MTGSVLDIALTYQRLNTALHRLGCIDVYYSRARRGVVTRTTVATPSGYAARILPADALLVGRYTKPARIDDIIADVLAVAHGNPRPPRGQVDAAGGGGSERGEGRASAMGPSAGVPLRVMRGPHNR